MLYMTFENSNKIGMFPFEPRRIYNSLQAAIEENSDSKLVALTELPVQDIFSDQGNIVLQHAESNENEI